MKKIFTWSEILNTTLHILLGGALCYAFLPKAPYWVLILFTGAAGGIREYIQQIRKHPNSPYTWMKYWDTFGFILGALAYIGLRYIGLDADR